MVNTERGVKEKLRFYDTAGTVSKLFLLHSKIFLNNKIVLILANNDIKTIHQLLLFFSELF